MNQAHMTHDNTQEDKIEPQKFLLTETNFHRLKQLQQEIHNETDVFPSLRKLINLIIDDDTINRVRKQLIDQLR